MSNKNKIQSQQQQQQPQQQQQQNQQQRIIEQQQQLKVVELVPPRYQPPPQPQNSGLAKAPPVNNNTTSGLNLHHHHHLHQQHQQQQQQPQHLLQHTQLLQQSQAARLASRVKDAVQSKFAQKVELTHTQQPRIEPSQQAYIVHPTTKAYLPNTVPAPSSATSATTNNINNLHSGIAAVSSNGPTNLNQNLPTASSARPRISDDEFLRLGPVEMLKFVRKTEGDLTRIAAEQHRQIQALINELRLLKEANQRLSDDNQELRDLCCFLDDDRQKGRKLAREWQRFGRYTASVMRQEVSAYQNKLRQLDNKQQELIKDNLELKELCLYLDEERGGGQRDDGDGSSSSTNAEENPPTVRTSRQNATTFNDQTVQYVRSLEQRIKQLEEDKSLLQARNQGWPAPAVETWDNPNSPNSDNLHLGSRPEAVVRALQVLEVREQLEREAGHDGEKALVREMCNVVWRKLEEAPQ